jgi:hypothetical protein
MRIVVRLGEDWLTSLLRKSEKVNPDFAYSSTVHFMRGLWLVARPALENPEQYIQETIVPVLAHLDPLWVESAPNEARMGSILEQVYRAADLANGIHVQALNIPPERRPSLVLGAIGAWYYAMYSLALALLSSLGHRVPASHSGVANSMSNQAVRRLLPEPFCVIARQRKDLTCDLDPPGYPRDHKMLISEPTTLEQGRAAIGAYVAGTWEREMDLISKELRTKHGVRKLNNKLRRIRDQRINDAGFFHSLYRYRTKAHYRDGIYTSYGHSFVGADRYLEDCVAAYQHLALVVESVICHQIRSAWYRRYIEDLARLQRDRVAEFPTRWQGPAILAVIH